MITSDNVWAFSILAAVLPVVFYVGLIYWVDRYEKEPWWLLSAAFVWGALPAALLSLVSNTILSIPLYLLLDNASVELLSGGLIAPVVEEMAKGLILVAIFFFWRSELDSPLDGIIYGAMIGMGFAMVENVLYYQAAFMENGQAGWNFVVLMRGVLFGLGHALYTSMTGLGIAIARLSTRWLVKLFAPLLGVGMAIFLHAFHNLAMYSGSPVGFLAGLSFDWGGIILTIAIIIMALRQERRWMKQYLEEEVSLGTLSPAEYNIITSSIRRNRFQLDQLLSVGIVAYRQSSRRFHHSSELAYRKHHFNIFGDDQSQAAIEKLRSLLATDSAQVG